MSYFYLEDVERNYKEGIYQNELPYPSKRTFKENHVFDEDKSVKWNREKVIEENENIKKERKLYNSRTNELNDLFTNDCITAIQNEFKLNLKQAEIVYTYAYREYHSCINDMFIHLNELAEMVSDVIKNS